MASTVSDITTLSETKPIEIHLTDGAVKNGYLRLPAALVNILAHNLEIDRTLCLDGMGEVDGTIDARKGMFRWRGWRKFFKHHGLHANDVVTISLLKDGRVRVSPHHNSLIEMGREKTAQEDNGSKKQRRPIPKNKRCNELDGATWLQYSLSVWGDIRKSPEEQKLGHPAMFPAALVDRLIRAYMRPNGRVILDPFMGSGSTLVAARTANKYGIGIEISPEYIELAKRRLEQSTLRSDSGDFEILLGDAGQKLKKIEPESVDLCVTSPPYWNILNQKRTADSKEIRHYGNLPNDLGTIDSYDEFIQALGEIFGGVLKILRPKAYCCVNVMDLRKQEKFYPFHADLARHMESRGYLFDDMIIWNRGQEYNNLRPLGYPYTFRINKIHEYILIFQKPG